MAQAVLRQHVASTCLVIPCGLGAKIANLLVSSVTRIVASAVTNFVLYKVRIMRTRNLSFAWRWLCGVGLLAMFGQMGSAAACRRGSPAAADGPQRGSRRRPERGGRPVRSQCRGPDSRTSTRGLCRTRVGGPDDRRDRSQATRPRGRRGAPRHETRGRKRGVDPRLLELGRRSSRLSLGQWRLARAPARLSLDARLLAGSTGPRASMGFRLLDARPPRRSDLFSRSLRKASKMAPRAQPRVQTSSGSPAIGNGWERVTSGNRATGRCANRTGSGFRRAIIGARAAGSTCPATGITPWSVADWSSRPCISPDRWPSIARRSAWT